MLDDVGVNDGLESCFEQPLMTATGVISKAIVALTCFIMDAAYPANRAGKLTRPALAQ